ncbi:zinc finger with UFM1-specific peptidase domain protein [Pseudohyphozyma bogoriensis]|nr:zinc finger with UFM1-specific peptidase domain protein [Pseudohyphozyma bogoriensis]
MRTTHAEACLVGGGVGEEEEDWEERVRDGDAFQNGGREEAERGKIVLGKGSSKDRVYGTPALIPPLSQLLTRSHKDGRTTAAFLCCRDVEHVGTKLGDFGWGCGYRNAQMIYSSLLHMPCYAHLPSSSDSGGLPAIPTIPEFQSIIEMAWKCGYDPPGAAHFKGRLRGSRKWIGTTEVYVALTFLGIRTKIFDFPKNKKGDQGTNEVLVPLYLQHDGHSRTVVGVDRGKNGDWLLIFDPSKSPNKHLVEASSALLQSHSKRLKTSPPPFFTPAHSSHSHSNPKHAAFWDAAPGFNQIWTGKGSRPGFGRGSGGKEEKGALEVEKHSKLLEPYRVSLKSLSRNREYQVLYVEEGPLTESEKRSRKVIHSTRCT